MQDLYDYLERMKRTHHISHFKVTEVFLGSLDMLKVFVYWKPGGRTTVEHIELYDWIRDHKGHKVTHYTPDRGLTTIFYLQEVGFTKWSADVIDQKPVAVRSESGRNPPAKRTCLDCKDGFYYPFSGKREPCKTCSPN